MRSQMNSSSCMTWAPRLLVTGIVALLAGCSTMKQGKLLAPTWFGMEQIGPRVYVMKEVPQNKRQELLDSYHKARSLVSAIYGSTITDAAIYGCFDRECIRTFGGHGDGYAAGKVTPGILLWTKVFGPGEVAHEWSHIELYARTGRSGMRTIPMWFHEGLATVVGDIPRHSEAVYQEAVSSGFPIPPLSELRTEVQWGEAFKKYPNAKGLNVVYSTAGHEVRAWLQRVGQQGLLTLIEAVKSGEDFNIAFQRIEMQAVFFDKKRRTL
jgi:hypothetical protein